MFWLGDSKICRGGGCGDKDLTARLADRSVARQWLQPFRGDVFKMGAMRSLLRDEGTAADFSRLSDDAVIDQIAGLLACGHLHIHVRASQQVTSDAPKRQGPAPAKVSDVSAPFPFSERKPSEPAVVSKQKTIDPATFSPKTDFAAQAATLVAAANQGSAACYL